MSLRQRSLAPGHTQKQPIADSWQMHLALRYCGDSSSIPRTTRNDPRDSARDTRLARKFSWRPHDERLCQPHSWEISTPLPTWGPLPSGLSKSIGPWPDESHHSTDISSGSSRVAHQPVAETDLDILRVCNPSMRHPSALREPSNPWRFLALMLSALWSSVSSVRINSRNNPELESTQSFGRGSFCSASAWRIGIGTPAV